MEITVKQLLDHLRSRIGELKEDIVELESAIRVIEESTSRIRPLNGQSINGNGMTTAKGLVEKIEDALGRIGTVATSKEIVEALHSQGFYREVPMKKLRPRINSCLSAYPHHFRKVRFGVYGLCSWGESRDTNKRCKKPLH